MASDSPPPPPPAPPPPPSVEIADMSVKSTKKRKVCHGRVGGSATDVAIFKAVASHNPDGAEWGDKAKRWKQVAETVGGGISPELCKQRYNKVLEKYPNKNRLKKWPRDPKLRALVKVELHAIQKREDDEVVLRIESAVRYGQKDSLDAFRAPLGVSEPPPPNASVENEVAALTKSISVITNNRDELEKQVATLTGQVTALGKTKEQLEGNEKDLKKRISALETNEVDFKEEVKSLEATNARQRKQIMAHERAEAAAQRALAEEMRKVKELETALVQAREQSAKSWDDVNELLQQANEATAVFCEQ